MPTYKNTTQETLNLILTSSNNYTKINPFNVVESEIIYDIDGLVKTDDAPYFNPVLQQSNVELADDAATLIVTLDSDATVIEIVNSSNETIYCYFQDVANTPAMIITAGTIRSLENFKRYCNKLVLKSSDTISTNTVFVSQFLE